MQTQIQLTVDYLNERITSFTVARDSLLKISDAPAILPQTEIALTPPQKVKSLVKIERHQQPKKKFMQPKTEKVRGGNFGKSEKYANALRSLVEPFNADGLVKASGCTRKQAEQVFFNWKEKGLLRRVSTGQYERTKDFPAAEIAATSAPIKTPAPAPAPVRPTTPPPAASSRDVLNAREQSVYHAAMKLPEPFTAESIAVATSISADAASLAMSGLLSKGFIKATGKEDGMTLYKIAK